jgi:hypothetical protein
MFKHHACQASIEKSVHHTGVSLSTQRASPTLFICLNMSSTLDKMSSILYIMCQGSFTYSVYSG